MDRAMQEALDRLEQQLGRIAYALETAVVAASGCTYSHRCSECRCSLLDGTETVCPSCRVALKGRKDASGG